MPKANAELQALLEATHSPGAFNAWKHEPDSPHGLDEAKALTAKDAWTRVSELRLISEGGRHRPHGHLRTLDAAADGVAEQHYKLEDLLQQFYRGDHSGPFSKKDLQNTVRELGVAKVAMKKAIAELSKLKRPPI